MRFQSREQAARLLARKLAKYRGQRPLVLAIPRGAAPMAAIIADSLGGEIDVVLVHKLGAPGQPELAIGSVDESGHTYLSGYVRDLGISADYIAAEREAQIQTLRRRRALYTPNRPPIDPAGRVVVVVDNGIATGATMIAALRAVRAQKPARLIAAVAVVPASTLKAIEGEADEVVCLHAPLSFYAVGEFFEDFFQVEDDTVAAILRQDRSLAQAGK